MRSSEGKNSNWTMLKDQRKIDIENVSGKDRLMYENFDFGINYMDLIYENIYFKAFILDIIYSFCDIGFLIILII